MVFYASVIVNLFDFQILQFIDIAVMISIISTNILYAMLFAFSCKNLERVIFSEAKGMFEMK